MCWSASCRCIWTEGVQARVTKSIKPFKTRYVNCIFTDPGLFTVSLKKGNGEQLSPLCTCAKPACWQTAMFTSQHCFTLWPLPLELETETGSIHLLSSVSVILLEAAASKHPGQMVEVCDKQDREIQRSRSGLAAVQRRWGWKERVQSLKPEGTNMSQYCMSLKLQSILHLISNLLGSADKFSVSHLVCVSLPLTCFLSHIPCFCVLLFSCLSYTDKKTQHICRK